MGDVAYWDLPMYAMPMDLELLNRQEIKVADGDKVDVFLLGRQRLILRWQVRDGPGLCPVTSQP